jgi:hypothetical protein
VRVRARVCARTRARRRQEWALQASASVLLGGTHGIPSRKRKKRFERRWVLGRSGHAAADADWQDSPDSCPVRVSDGKRSWVSRLRVPAHVARCGRGGNVGAQ